MASFKIIQTDPEEFKEQILAFWKDCLPGTPPGRFEWMQKNPAGPAIWFFAFEKDENELSGTISIMPREMVLNGKSIKAGIVGDFMVSKKYRVFGPALGLQKTVLQSMSDYGFDYVYTIPNQASLKMSYRAGYVDEIKLVHYIKPIRSAPYLRKYFNEKISTYIGCAFDYVTKIFSKESYVSLVGNFDEVITVNNTFDALWVEIQKTEENLIGIHSLEFIDWRYLKNPISAFHIITLRSNSEVKLLGCVIYSMIGGEIEIYDILSLKKSYRSKLLSKVIHVAQLEKCKAIYIRLAENSTDIRNLRKFMFFNAKNEISVFVSGKNTNIFNHWAFSEGDRNS